MSGVVVTGSGRSGTSMVAGIFAAHGVAFGRCKPADEHNPRGYWEHPVIPRPSAKCRAWPGVFFQRIGREGWDPREPWGAKQITTRWKWLRALEPTVVVLCVRPADDVRASWERTGWKGDIERVIRRARVASKRIRREARCPVVTVHANLVVAGDYSELRRAFEILGVPFSEAITRDWVLPDAWHSRREVAA